MKVPVKQGGSDEQQVLDIRIEETTQIAFNLGDSSDYATVGGIEGRLIVEYDINRGTVMEEIERVRNPSVTDRLDMFWHEWSAEETDLDNLTLEFGKLMLRGSGPIDELSEVMQLEPTVPREKFEQTSPTDLRRELREGVSYSTTYDEVADDIRKYLQEEGISPESFEMGVPVHMQARAEPIAADGDDPANQYDQDVYGTKFTITIDNRAPRRIAPSTLSVSMQPRIGREVITLDGADGAYNQADEQFEFDIPQIDAGAGADGGSETLSFVVPQSAGKSLDRLSGAATLNTHQPFTNYVPEAIFDAGGQKVWDPDTDGDGSYASVNWTCSVEADFEVETAEIMVGDSADIEKRVTIEGVPPNKAESKIETILAQRGIDTSGGVSADRTETREGAEVTTFSGEFSNGTVVVEGSRISIDVRVSGERRTGQAEREETSETNLPTRQRNTTFEYGRTGLVIRGSGADPERVESYVGDLRSELKMSLESMAEEV